MRIPIGRDRAKQLAMLQGELRHLGREVRGHTWRDQLIAAAVLVVALSLLGSCASGPKPSAEEKAQSAFNELHAAVLSDIPDAARAQQAAGLVDQLAREDRAAREALVAQRQRVLALDADYDSKDEDFKKVFADFNNERVQRQKRMVELWTQMAGLTTDSEWRAIKRARVAAAKALTNPG